MAATDQILIDKETHLNSRSLYQSRFTRFIAGYSRHQSQEDQSGIAPPRHEEWILSAMVDAGGIRHHRPITSLLYVHVTKWP